ncbi:hypothetical protein SUDANB58_00275 [Streptomyces sp. enrichment culture]|uniref:hypothetical protein n=1 Tax=Streptomyces sp. enrichment culture TaxID=1795815 RepID=UPI003F55777D
MTSASFHHTITLPASLCEQAAQHLEQAVQRAVDGAAAPWRAFRQAESSDYAFPVPVVEQAAVSLLVLAAESAQSMRPSALRALISVALRLRDAADTTRQPTFTTTLW